MGPRYHILALSALRISRGGPARVAEVPGSARSRPGPRPSVVRAEDGVVALDDRSLQLDFAIGFDAPDPQPPAGVDGRTSAMERSPIGANDRARGLLDRRRGERAPGTVEDVEVGDELRQEEGERLDKWAA